MRIVALGDTHLGYVSGRTSKARQQMQQYVLDSFQQAVKHAKFLRADVILHLGDIFDRRNIRGQVLEDYFSVVQYALQTAAYISIAGNHDAHQPDSLIEFLQTDYHPIRQLSSLDIGEVLLVGFPYTKKPKALYNKAERLVRGSSKPVIGLFHQIFYGTWFGPQRFTFRFADAIRTHPSSPITLNLSGHIHRAQLLQGNVLYPGSIVRTSFVETIEPKGFVVIDIEDNYVHAQFHELPTRPMEVHELDIRTESIEDLKINSKVHTLIRAYGSKLTAELRQSINMKFPADEYPFLSISPRNTQVILRPLYNQFTEKFIPPNFSVSL